MIYLENENLKDNSLKHITTMGSAAHTYGNLLATAEKWVLDIPFFNNFFKTIHVQSQIAHEQIIRNSQNFAKKFIKKSKPIIIFRPRISYDEDTFLAKTMMVERMGGGLVNSDTPGTIDLHPFLYDRKNGLNLQFSEVRRVMYLDVICIFDTLIQQLNFMDALMNEFVKNRPFDINTWLEAYLPREYMDIVGQLSGVPVHSSNGGSVKEFLDYMNDNACYPVIYKLAGSTGKEEFYRYYNTKILTTLTDLDKSDGESMGQVMTNYQITFTLKMEFWTPGINYIFSPHITSDMKLPQTTDSTLIPIYADVFNYEDLDLPPGWKIYQHASYQLDKPKDSVNFSDLLDESIQEIINYHLKNGIPLVNFFDIKVRKQGKLIYEGYDYRIDYANRTIYFNNTDYGWYTYTIIIGIDVGYINRMIEKLFDLK